MSPGNLDAVFYKGICLFQESRFKEALPSLQLVAKALSNEPYAHFYLGSIYEREGSAGPALAEFQQCAAIDPNFELAVYRVGYLLAKSGKIAEAIVEFKKAFQVWEGGFRARCGAQQPKPDRTIAFRGGWLYVSGRLENGNGNSRQNEFRRESVLFWRVSSYHRMVHHGTRT